MKQEYIVRIANLMQDPYKHIFFDVGEKVTEDDFVAATDLDALVITGALAPIERRKDDPNA